MKKSWIPITAGTTPGRGGYEGALKYYFSPLSFAQLDAAVSNPYTATDAQVGAYADIHLEHDDARKVTKSVGDVEVRNRTFCLWNGSIPLGSLRGGAYGFGIST